ncbi:MAG: hypothetical protein RLZZ135_2039 [Cyanobacteriota bacterium]|jgi:hypothetical protein
MLKKIWHSFMKWIRKSLGMKTANTAIVPRRLANERIAAQLPLLDDTDREYLFMQLLEGVAHGWQQPRVVNFFNKLRQRVRKSDWLDWLDRFGNNLLEMPVPNYELAGRMVQLSQLDCGEIGDLAGEYGERLLERQAEAGMPIMEFSTDMEGMSLDENGFFNTIEDSRNSELNVVPPELSLDFDPIGSVAPQSFQPQVDPNSATETREITLEEFSAMLHQDPTLVAELAEQFGIETSDPQMIISAVIAKMQQQGQPNHHNPNDTLAAETPAKAANSRPTQQLPPLPPTPKKLEYKSDDPWSENLANDTGEFIPKTANLPDRGV